MCFGGMSSSRKTKERLIEPNIPTENDAEVLAAIEKEKELALRRKGRQSTILTGFEGLGGSGN